MRVVHIQLYGLEQVLDLLVLNHSPVDQIFVTPSHDYLPSHGDFIVLCIAHRTLALFFVFIVEDNGHASLSDTGLALLVDELLQGGDSHLG